MPVPLPLPATRLPRATGPLAFMLGAALTACGAEPAPPPYEPPPIEDTAGAEAVDPLAHLPGRPPNERERRAFDQLQRLAEQTRHLTFERPVPFRIQDREVITQFVRDQIEADELERARVFYVALGLLAPDLDIHELLVAVLGEQIVGYYDPEQSLMVIRDDVAAQLSQQARAGGSSRSERELGEAEMVIVHELVHALQDQRLELGAHYEEERTIDGENAFAALVEGDATLAMIGHLVARNGQPLSNLTQNAAMLRMLVRSNPQAIQGQEIERAPPIVRLPLVSRYLDGMIFSATLHGGNGWPGVDSAHRVPPVSTEQVLHPERYVAGEQPDPVTLPALPDLEEAGLTPHEEDTLGELEMGIYFGLGVDGEREESAAEGWGGDRLRVYRDDEGGTAVVWFTTWDDPGEAREAEQAARAVVSRLPAGADRDRHLVERRGSAVLILRGLDPALHRPVRRAFAAFAEPTPPAAPPNP